MVNGFGRENPGRGSIPLIYINRVQHMAYDTLIPSPEKQTVSFQGNWARLTPEKQQVLWSRPDFQAVRARIQWVHGQETTADFQEVPISDASGKAHPFYLLTVSEPIPGKRGEKYLLPQELTPDVQEHMVKGTNGLGRESFVTVVKWDDLHQKGYVEGQGKASLIPFADGRSSDDLTTIDQFFTLWGIADRLPPTTLLQLNPYSIVYRKNLPSEKQAEVGITSLLKSIPDNGVSAHLAQLYPDAAERAKIEKFLKGLSVFVHFRPPQLPEGGSAWVLGGSGHVSAEASHWEIRGQRKKKREPFLLRLPLIDGTSVEEGTEELQVRRNGRLVPFYAPSYDNRLLGVNTSTEYGQVSSTHAGIAKAVWLPQSDTVVINTSAKEGSVSAMIPYSLLLAWTHGAFEARQDGFDNTREQAWGTFINFLSRQCGVPMEELIQLPRRIHIPPWSIIDEKAGIDAAFAMSRDAKKGIRRIPFVGEPLFRRTKPTIPDKLLIVEYEDLQ